MSVGNLKDEGNKGNNFPFQLRLLQILGTIANNTSGGGTYPASVQRVPTLTRVSGAGVGTITAGKQEVAIYNAGSSNATVLGSTLKPGERVSFQPKAADTLGAITYNALTSELVITTLT